MDFPQAYPEGLRGQRIELAGFPGEMHGHLPVGEAGAGFQFRAGG